MTTTMVAATHLFAYLHKTKSGNLHLRVRQSPYSDEFKARLHRVGSPATWSPEGAPFTWDYALTASAVVALQRVVDETGATIEWAADLAQFAAEQAKVEAYEKQVRLSIEKAINDQQALPVYPTRLVLADGRQVPPMRHQQISYHWALRASGLLLAHEPGLGKTRSGCDVIGGWYRENIVRPMQQFFIAPQYNKEGKQIRGGRWGVRGGVLVVCPHGMIRTWRDELMQWQNALGLEITGGTRAKKNEKAGMIAHAHIINYESLDVVLCNEYDAVVIDEIHRCANHSEQTINVLELVQQTRRRLGLSGTPVSNNLESVYYQMLIIDSGRALGPNKTAFTEQWFTTETVGPGITQNTPKPGAVEAVSKAMARATYFLKKEECIDLPPRLHNTLSVPMTDEQQSYYDKIKDEALVYIQDSTVTLEQAAARMMKLRQVAQGFVLDDERVAKEFSSAKNDILIDILTNKLRGRKVVVWSVFTFEINRLCATLQKLNIGFVRFDGTIKSKKVRDASLELWNNNPQVTVFVGQIAMGVGITLHAQQSIAPLQSGELRVPCFDCIYTGVDYSYTNWVQSVDRIHRIGQQYACNYTYLLTPSGIDRNIYKALQVKANTAQAVHRTGKAFFASLLTDDIPLLGAVA